MSDFDNAVEVAKLRVLQSKNAGLLGPLICSMDIIEADQEEPASTDGVNIFVNREKFMALPPKSRTTLLMHEVWHVAKLHHPRGEGKDLEKWNLACDYHNDYYMHQEGYSYEGLESHIDFIESLPHLKGKSEEEIYKWLKDNKSKDDQGDQGDDPDPNGSPSGNGQGEGQGEGNGQGNQDPNQKDDGKPKPEPQKGNEKGDLKKQTQGQEQKQMANVIQAVQSAQMSGGYDPNAIAQLDLLIDDFFTPEVNWKALLNKYLNDLCDEDYTWKIRNRRFRSVYLPSLQEEESKLEHLAYYLDVSGSVSDADVKRFNSELKYIFDQMKPSKITVVMFDTGIRKEVVFNEGDKFDKILITGRGGTCLECVRQHIIDNKPTAAIIFSDMYCDEMRPFKQDTDLIWMVIGDKKPDPFKGKVIHIKNM